MSTLADIMPNEVVLTLRNPLTKEELETTITLVGEYSPEYYHAKNVIVREKEMYKDISGLITTAGNKYLVKSVIKGWSKMEIIDDGERVALEFNEENLDKVLDAMPFVIDQVGDQLQLTADFFRT